MTEQRVPTLQLWGSPTCPRYQRMRRTVLNEAQRLGVDVQLEEINDAGRLAGVNPLHLPQVRMGERVLARGNPPTPETVAQWLDEDQRLMIDD